MQCIYILFFAGNFRAPEEGEFFNQVRYIGQTKEEADELIRKYNREGGQPREDRPFNRGFGGRDMDRDRGGSYGRPLMAGFRPRCEFYFKGTICGRIYIQLLGENSRTKELTQA